MNLKVEDPSRFRFYYNRCLESVQIPNYYVSHPFGKNKSKIWSFCLDQAPETKIEPAKYVDGTFWYVSFVF